MSEICKALADILRQPIPHTPWLEIDSGTQPVTIDGVMYLPKLQKLPIQLTDNPHSDLKKLLFPIGSAPQQVVTKEVSVSQADFVLLLQCIDMAIREAGSEWNNKAGKPFINRCEQLKQLLEVTSTDVVRKFS